MLEQSTKGQEALNPFLLLFLLRRSLLRLRRVGDRVLGLLPPSCSLLRHVRSKCLSPLLEIGIIVRDGINVRGFNTLLGQISPMFTGSPEKPVLGVNVAFVWMTLNIGCWLYVYFFIPELKGLQLEQVDELYL